MSRARNRPLSVRRIPCRSRAILVRTDPLTHTLDDQVDCWECGNNCFDCIEKTQQACKRCLGGYCLIHNEGCTKTLVSTCGDRSFYLQAATDAEPQCDCKAATAGGCERPVRTNRSSQGAQAVDGEYENSTEGAKSDGGSRGAVGWALEPGRRAAPAPDMAAPPPTRRKRR